MARIGVYGGSFNPPHLGHIFAARKAQQLLGLDKVLLIPAAIPPHKAVAEGSPDGETRLALTKLAIAGEAGMEVSRIELDRPGPSYTVDTLRTLRECYPQDALYLLMGTDMFLSFFQWRDPEHIARLAVPVCMARVRRQQWRPRSVSDPLFYRMIVWKSRQPRPEGFCFLASRMRSCTRMCAP